MINRYPRAFIISSLLRLLEISDIPDICDRSAVESDTTPVALIKLVVEDEKFLPFSVENPALVRIGCSLVGGNGDYFGECLVRDVVLVATLASHTSSEASWNVDGKLTDGQ